MEGRKYLSFIDIFSFFSANLPDQTRKKIATTDKKSNRVLLLQAIHFAADKVAQYINTGSGIMSETATPKMHYGLFQ